jgi:predicted O-methyltransferase YrrM
VPIAKQMDDRLHAYLLQHTREPQVLTDLRSETEREVPIGARMLVPPEQGAFMAFLVQALNVRRAIEVGVFTGYSSTAVAMALPDDGVLVACDRDAKTMDIAQRCWQHAGVAHKIEARLGQGEDTLQQLLDAGQADLYDFAFIDADKRATDRYYEMLLRLVRPGGVIAVDNVLFRGRVADPEDTDKKVVALRDFNSKLLSDERITLSIVPLGDGIALCRRSK